MASAAADDKAQNFRIICKVSLATILMRVKSEAVDEDTFAFLFDGGGAGLELSFWS